MKTRITESAWGENMVEQDTIKFTKALHEEFLPKLEGLEYTEVSLTENGDTEWHKPRKATLKDKLKLCNVIAERQAKLQAQIDWLHERQEYYRKLREE